MHDLTFIRPLVRTVLEDQSREWTVQGFGFLRTYFGPPDKPKKFRLNLWDSAFTVPRVSTIHTHPWDFTSLIVGGLFFNQRYDIGAIKLPDDGPTHTFTTIKTGVGGGLTKTAPEFCTLIPRRQENYGPGDAYHQVAHEIHETLFANGSVTLNERVGDTEQAKVFWPFNTAWVDAIPRPATTMEVSNAVERSLEKWF